MPLVYAGVVPHAPLLIPAIAKDHRPLLSATRQELKSMAAELHARQVDVLVLLTPHGLSIPGVISVHVAGEYIGKLVEFGDVQTKLAIHGVPGAAHELKMIAERSEVPVVLQTYAELDYGATVPLSFLLPPDNRIGLIPISVGGQAPSLLLRFGSVLHEFFHGPRRYALIASADLARPKARSTPRRPTSVERQLAAALTKLDATVVPGLVPDPQLCGLGPIMTFIAGLQPAAARGVVRTFEAPLGVGLLTAEVDFRP